VDELKWELLTEVQGRLEAEFLKSYIEAQGIEVELFQESVGHHIYPVTVNGLGRVQISCRRNRRRRHAGSWMTITPQRSEEPLPGLLPPGLHGRIP
jgi:hypothetical protein